MKGRPVVAASAGDEPGIESRSRKEEVEAGVENRKGLTLLATHRYDDALVAFDESLKLRYACLPFFRVFLFFFFSPTSPFSPALACRVPMGAVSSSSHALAPVVVHSRMLNQEKTFDFAWTSLNYAVALSLTQNGTQVMSHFDEAFKLLEAQGKENSLVYAAGIAHQGRFLVRTSRIAEGVQRLRDAISRLERCEDKGSVKELAVVRKDLADTLSRSGDGAGAMELCRALLSEPAASENLWRGTLLVAKARAHLALGARDEAQAALDEARTVLVKHAPDEPGWLTRQKAAAPLQEADELEKQLRG